MAEAINSNGCRPCFERHLVITLGNRTLSWNQVPSLAGNVVARREIRGSWRIVGNSFRKPLPQSLNGRFAHDSARSSRHIPSDDGQILRNLRSHPMTAADFRRIALSLEGVEEYSHARLPAFRVGGRKFASLASQAGGYGNLMLALEQQCGVCGGGAREFPADSWRLGKGGAPAYSPGGERGCTDGCTPNGLETAN